MSRGGRIARRPAPRLMAALLAAALPTMTLLGGCTYDRTEPGLFDRPRPAMTATEEPKPDEQNLALPVFGEAVWTSAEGLGVTVRIAVHGVRRMADATILDWSVTPLSAPGLVLGEALPPSFDLGLGRFGEDNANLSLLDPVRGDVYRPMVRKSAGVPQCLCTQLRLVQLGLVIGQTRVLQMAFAPLPADVATVDVDIATVPVFDSVPVAPINTYPRAIDQVDLARAAEPIEPAARSDPFLYWPARQDIVVGIDRILAGPHGTSVAWSIEPLNAGRGLEYATDPPIGDDAAPEDSANRLVAAGPQLLAGAVTLHSRQIRTTAYGRPASECLCTDLRSWPTAAVRASGRVEVVTNLPALPAGTTSVAVLLPGAALIEAVPVVPARDAAATPVTLISAFPTRWTVRPNRPAAGWSPLAWPTPVPTVEDLARYAGDVERFSR